MGNSSGSKYDFCSEKYLRDPAVAAGQFFHIFCIVVIVIGVITNTLTCFIMMRPNIRRETTAIFLFSLAVFDSLKLIFHSFKWAGEYVNWMVDPKQPKTIFQSDTSCSFYMFSYKFVNTTAIWLVTTISIERLIKLFFPLHAKTTLLTRLRAKILVAAIIVLNILINIDYLILIKYNAKKGKCSARTYDKDNPVTCLYMSVVKGPLEAVWKLLPLFITLVMNFLIVVKLKRYSIQQEKDKGVRTHGGTAKEDINRWLKMLLVVSLVSSFLLLPPNIDSGIGKFVEQNSCPSYGNSTVEITKSPVKILDNFCDYINETSNWHCACNIIWKTYMAGRPFSLLNHAVNFFLYILLGSMFRKEFKDMLTEWCCSRRMKGLQGTRRRSSAHSVSRSCALKGQFALEAKWRFS